MVAVLGVADTTEPSRNCSKSRPYIQRLPISMARFTSNAPTHGSNKAKDGKSNDAKTKTYCAVPSCCIPFGDPGVVPAGFE